MRAGSASRIEPVSVGILQYPHSRWLQAGFVKFCVPACPSSCGPIDGDRGPDDGVFHRLRHCVALRRRLLLHPCYSSDEPSPLAWPCARPAAVVAGLTERSERHRFTLWSARRGACDARLGSKRLGANSRDTDGLDQPQFRRLHRNCRSLFTTSASSSVTATASGSSPAMAGARPRSCAALRDAEPGSGEIVTLARPAHRLCRAGRPHNHLMGLSLRDAVLDALPEPSRDSDGWRADVVLDEFDDAGGHAGAAGLGAERRLAEADADRADLGERARCAAARRADQPSRPRQDPAAGALAERQYARHAGGDRQPRSRLSRCDDQPNAVPQAWNVALFCPAVTRGRGRRWRRPTRLRREQQERDLKDAQQLRRQAAKLTNIGINSGSDLLTLKAKYLKERAAKIEAGGAGAAQGAVGRDQARQCGHARQGVAGARECDGPHARRPGAVRGRQAASVPGRPDRAAGPQRRRARRSSCGMLARAIKGDERSRAFVWPAR